MPWVNQTKHTSTPTNQTKHPVITFGDMPSSLLAGITGNDVVLNDGTTFDNVLFTTPVEGKLKNDYVETQFSNQTKHTATMINLTKH